MSFATAVLLSAHVPGDAGEAHDSDSRLALAAWGGVAGAGPLAVPSRRPAQGRMR
jgi:hypothetical protein